MIFITSSHKCLQKPKDLVDQHEQLSLWPMWCCSVLWSVELEPTGLAKILLAHLPPEIFIKTVSMKANKHPKSVLNWVVPRPVLVLPKGGKEAKWITEQNLALTCWFCLVGSSGCVESAWGPAACGWGCVPPNGKLWGIVRPSAAAWFKDTNKDNHGMSYG